MFRSLGKSPLGWGWSDQGAEGCPRPHSSLDAFARGEIASPAVNRLSKVFRCAAFLLLGCVDEGVGDPCAPQRPTDAGPPNYQNFLGSEIYIETQSLQCRSRICLVYRYSENTDSNRSERPKRVYCTCRCGVPESLRATTDPSVLCTCPDGYTCLTNLASEQYSEGVRGSYCVRSETIVR